MEVIIGKMQIGSCRFLIKRRVVGDGYEVEIEGISADSRQDAIKATALMDIIFGPGTTKVIHDMSSIRYMKEGSSDKWLHWYEKLKNDIDPKGDWDEDPRKPKTAICCYHGHRHVMRVSSK